MNSSEFKKDVVNCHLLMKKRKNKSRDKNKREIKRGTRRERLQWVGLGTSACQLLGERKTIKILYKFLCIKFRFPAQEVECVQMECTGADDKEPNRASFQLTV